MGDIADQVHGHIDGASAALLFEGQVPAWLGAAGALELAEGPFEKGADSGELAQGGVTGLGVPVGRSRFRFHINKLQYLFI